MRYLIASLFLSFVLLSGYSKDNNEKNSKIHMSYFKTNNSVLLRWAPDSPIAWKLCNKYGYQVERFIMKRDNKLLVNSERSVLIDKITHLPLPLWEAPADTSMSAAVAAEAIFGTSFELDSKSTDIMSMVNMSRELDNRFSFGLFSADNSFKVAKMMGLAFVDNKVKNNEAYLYKVYSLVPTDVAKIDTAYVFVDMYRENIMPHISDVTAKFETKDVTISWKQSDLIGFYNSFVVERSVNDNKHFEPLNSLPYVSASKSSLKEPKNGYYADTLPQIGINYYYRLRGKNSFGFYGPYSDTICVETYTKFTTKPTITSATVVDNKKVVVKWDFPVEYNMLSKGFRVMVSTSIRSNYKQVNTELIKPNIREFTITNPNRVNYIVVEAIDGGNNNYSSMPQMALLKDLVPPAKPVGLSGTVDSLGNVKLNWMPNADNDLLGYRVYFANNPNDEYSQITKEALTTPTFNYKVPLNTLNNFIYFKVQAIDQSFNRSLMSDYSKVVKPDTIPPTTPVIVVAEYANGAVYIKWHKSYSNDVKAEYLLRYHISEKPDTILRVFGGSQEYSDANIIDGQKYRYTVVAKDNSNNFSRKPIVVAVKIPKKDITIKNPFTAVADRVNNQILIEWSYSNTNSVYIYRAEANGKYRMIKTITGSENSFADKNVKLNTTYKYRLRATFIDGTNTKMSDEVVVNF